MSKSLERINNRDQVLDLVRRVIETGDQSLVQSHVETYMTAEHLEAFNIMSASGNNMDTFDKFLSLMEDQKFITSDDARDLIKQYVREEKNRSQKGAA